VNYALLRHHTLRNVAANLDDTTWEARLQTKHHAGTHVTSNPDAWRRCTTVRLVGTATVLKPNNVEYRNGVFRLWYHVCSVTKVCMKNSPEKKPDHMGKVILYYNLAPKRMFYVYGLQQAGRYRYGPRFRSVTPTRTYLSECWNSCVNY
jgi:hypothetical protein